MRSVLFLALAAALACAPVAVADNVFVSDLDHYSGCYAYTSESNSSENGSSYWRYESESCYDQTTILAAQAHQAGRDVYASAWSSDDNGHGNSTSGHDDNQSSSYSHGYWSSTTHTIGAWAQAGDTYGGATSRCGNRYSGYGTDSWDRASSSTWGWYGSSGSNGCHDDVNGGAAGHWAGVGAFRGEGASTGCESDSSGTHWSSHSSDNTTDDRYGSQGTNQEFCGDRVNGQVDGNPFDASLGSKCRSTYWNEVRHTDSSSGNYTSTGGSDSTCDSLVFESNGTQATAGPHDTSTSECTESNCTRTDERSVGFAFRWDTSPMGPLGIGQYVAIPTLP